MSDTGADERASWVGFAAAASLLFGVLGWWANSSLSDEVALAAKELKHLAQIDSIPVAMGLRDAGRLAESLDAHLADTQTLWRREHLIRERSALFSGPEIVDVQVEGPTQQSFTTSDGAFDSQVWQPQLARLTQPGKVVVGWAYARANSWWLPVFYRLRDGSLIVTSLPVSALVSQWGVPSLPGISPIGMRGSDDRVLFRQPFTAQMLGADGSGTTLAREMQGQIDQGQSSGVVRAVSVETDGIERLVGWAIVPGSDVRVLVAADMSQVVARWRAQTAPKFAVMAALLALTLAVAVFLRRRELRAWRSERAKSARTEQAQALVRQALDASRDTTWMWQRGAGALRFDADLAKLLEASVSAEAEPAQDPHGLDFLLRHVRQADKARITQSLTQAPDEADSIYEVFEAVGGDGRARHFVLKGGAIASGSPERSWLAGTLRDVSRLVRTQQDLSHTGETLERLGHIARIGAWEADIASGRMQFSAVARQLHGIGPGEPLPLWRDFHGAFGTDAAARLQAAKHRLVEHGESYDLVLPVSPTGGGTRWVRTVASPHFEAGSIVRMDGAVQDVTSLVESQARVSALNSRARMLAEAVATSSQLVLVTDCNERITWCNEAFIKLSGWTLEEVLGVKPAALLQRGTVPEHLRAHMQTCILAREAFAGVRLQNFSKGGQPYWVDLEVRPIVDEAGELEGFVGVQTDVTRDIDREQALMEATRRADLAIENAAIGLWELDLSTNVARWNRQMFDKFGFDTAREQPGIDEMWATLHEEGRESWRADFQRHAADPVAARWRGEFRVCRPAGGWRWLRSECAFERADDGQGLRALGTAVDVTAEHEAVDERAARAEADARNIAKTAFLSRMSHELRTPLNAVIGYAQLLGSGAPPLPDAALERLKRIERSGWHLLALIDDVLDLSRIESNALSVTPASMSLSDVAKEATVLVEPRVLQMGLMLELDLPSLWVHADATRVQQILSNLLSNAVKYNRPGGSVSIRLHRRGAMACVDVADTGLGMTAEQQAMLFEPFNRLGREYSSIEGTGIGLSIARALAKLMEGDIAYSSVAGQGSVFTLCLPLTERGAQAAAPEPLANAPMPDATLDVLCVEDNEVNAMVLEESIRRLCPTWTVRQAATAAAALEALRRAPCDLMLLDINLPDQTGLQMLALARLENLVAPSQVVVLSADVMPQTRRAARDAGITQFLDKPFRLTELKRMLEQAALSAAE